MDIWALGLTVYTMYSMGRHPLWDSSTDTKKSLKTKLLANEPWPSWPPNMGEFFLYFSILDKLGVLF